MNLKDRDVLENQFCILFYQWMTTSHEATKYISQNKEIAKWLLSDWMITDIFETNEYVNFPCMAYYIADGEPLKKAFNVAEIFSMCLGGFYMYSINLETYNPSLHVKQWNIIYIYIYIYMYVYGDMFLFCLQLL